MSKEARQGRATEATAGLPRHHAGGPGLGVLAGEIAGGVVGSAAGPAGAVAGMIVGAIAGEVVGEVLQQESARTTLHDQELDAAIGVIGGDLGAARPGAPRARIGAPSLASLGLGDGPSSTPAEGPIQDVDDG